MERSEQQKDALYWANVAKLAEEANSRKEAVSLLHELQRHKDRISNTTPIY